MKNLFSLIIAVVLVAGLTTSCTLAGDKPFSNYTEVCNTESYYERPLSLPVGFQNFSMGKYMEFYASYNGSICKFTDAGELRITYEDTLGFSAPYYYDGYIYAVSNGCLYQINSGLKGGMTQIGERMDGTGANCVVVNDSFALITLHHYNENNKFSLKLMRVDLGTGEATELDLGTEQRLYCSAGGVMYVYTKEVVDREEVYSLYEIPVEGEPIYICDMTDVGAVAKFVLEDGVFYYGGTNGDLCAKSLITGDITTCVYGVGIFDMGQYMETGMAFYQGNIIYYNANTGCIESIFVPNFGFSDKKVITIAAPEDISVSHINLSELAKYTDVEINYITISQSEMLLKIMAGDTDVDIYLVTGKTARILLEKNIYTPLESETIADFNDSCFDYIADYCLADTGDIGLMPVSSYVPAIVYPLEAADEVGFTKDDLRYFDDFMEFVRNHGSTRNPFQAGTVIFDNLHTQYTEYYCDMKNGKFDYTTDLYRSFYCEPELSDKKDDQETMLFKSPMLYIDERHPEANPKSLIDPNHFSDITLLCAGLYNYSDYAENCPTFFTEWGAAPMPSISEQATGNFVDVEFAYINPHIESKESAIEVLEVISQNLMNIRGGQALYSFILEDKTAYAKDYHPESQVFNDYFDIAKKGFIFSYYWEPTIRDKYFEGILTADEALESYQRQVEIWLNE